MLHYYALTRILNFSRQMDYSVFHIANLNFIYSQVLETRNKKAQVVACRCSVKRIFNKIWKNLQANICCGVFFFKTKFFRTVLLCITYERLLLKRNKHCLRHVNPDRHSLNRWMNKNFYSLFIMKTNQCHKKKRWW